MVSYSFDEATLSAAAGVNPWQQQRQLATGDPAAIEALASAFYKHSSHSGDAAAATKASQTYVKQGYTVQGSSPLDVNAEAERLVKDPHIGAEHTYQIGKILQGVGTDLDTAATGARTEVTTLNSRIGTLLQQFQQTVSIYHHTGEDREPENGEDAALQGIFNEAVSATRTHGATVGHLLTGYETSLHSALKSMADLGYVPADGHDEGPGGIDLTAGSKDGATTVSAARSGNTATLTQSTYALSIINDAIAHDGGRVDDGEYSYLNQYYLQTAGHSDVIDAAIKKNGLGSTVGATYADGLLNLTRGAEQPTDDGRSPTATSPTGGYIGRGGAAGLPSSVQKVLNSDLGTTPGTGTFQIPVRRAEWVDGHWVIANLGNDQGFADLLSYAHPGVQGGTAFSQMYGESAIRWKQELNTIDRNTYNWIDGSHHNNSHTGAPDVDLSRTGLPDGFTGTFDAHGNPVNSDHFAAQALATVSRNADASANLLIDPSDRRAVLGLNWHDGSGAADVLTSGTAPDPTGTSRRNEATLDVFKDVSSDYKSLEGLSTPEIKNALAGVVARHIDTFAYATPDNSGATHSLVGFLVGPDGKPHQGVILGNADMGNVLKFVADSGPADYGLVHAAALEEGAHYVAHANQVGGAGATEALKQASLLDGRVNTAGVAAAIDAARNSNATDKSAYAAHLVAEQQQATDEWHDKLLGDGMDVVLGVAGKVPGFGTAADVAGLFQTGANAVQDLVDGPADVHTPDTNAIQSLQTNLAQALNDPSQLAQSALAVDDGQKWMAVRAQALNDPQHLGPLVDAHGLPLPHFGAVDGANPTSDPHAPSSVDQRLTQLVQQTYAPISGQNIDMVGGSQILAGTAHSGGSFSGGTLNSTQHDLDGGDGGWSSAASQHAIIDGSDPTFVWKEWSITAGGVPNTVSWVPQTVPGSP